jgi:hypothetical protein
VLTFGEAPVCFRGRGEVDDVRLDARKSMVSSTNSIASRHGVGSWLEPWRGSVRFGRGRGLRFPAFLVEMVASVRAPKYGKKIRDQREWRSTSQTSISTMDVAGICRLRREISAAWRRAERGKGGGKAERATGYL